MVVQGYKVKNIVGRKIGRLTAIKYIDVVNNKSRWLFKCDCGNEKVIFSAHVKSENTVSCGCLQKERKIAASTKHGACKTKTYKIWTGIKARCTNPNRENYNRYGGSGIKICDRWNASFDNFLKDMGECPSNLHSIERIDPNKNYTKNNCKWELLSKQNRNKKNSLLVEFNGEKRPLIEWCEMLGMKYSTIFQRLYKLKQSPNQAFRPLYTSTFEIVKDFEDTGRGGFGSTGK